MKKAIFWIVIIVVIVGAIIWARNSSAPSDVDVDLSTPEAVEEATEVTADDIDQIEIEEAEIDAELDELEELSF